jgi:1-aminocyclopropane-1-carboxylate deaminase/D-cysteine desulfhydrase-like pyridoxal-dependent ACC family enzyme
MFQVSKEEYASIGATRLGAALTQQLQQQGLKPYYIPVGGSSALGCWGYLNAAEEIAEQQRELGLQFDVLASVSKTCSGGCQ